MAGGGAAPSGGGGRVIIIKKKGKGHGGHHGGAWKVAYADFVTAMMAFFMVMWLLAQTDQQTRQQLSEYFRTGVFSGAPSVLNGGSGIQNKAYFDVVGQSSIQPETQAFERVAAAVRAAMQRSMAEDPTMKKLAQQLKVSVTEEGLLIQILDGSGDDLLFDRSSVELKPRLEELLAAMGKFNEELVKAGVMLAGEGLHPSSKGKRVKFSSGRKTVVDGPFAETKELIAGFWLWQCKSMAEAVEWVKRCPDPMPGEESEIEIRQVFEAEDFGAEFTPELRAQEERIRAEAARLAKSGSAKA